MKILAGGLITTAALLFCLGASGAGEKKKKLTIADVMAKAHKSGLLKKVVAGKADEAQRKELAELYAALALCKPPKGELAAWKKVTTAMAKAAKAAVADANKGAALGKLVNCGKCHDTFKEDD